jgi:integrase
MHPAAVTEGITVTATPASKDSARSKSRSDGEGSVHQEHKKACSRVGRCDCRWVGVLVLGYRDAQRSRRITRKVSAHTRAGAASKLRELRDSIARNEEPRGSGITVAEWMEYWFGTIAPRKVKPLTLAGYDAKVNQYIVPLLGHIKLKALSVDQIEDAWDQLRDSGNPTKAEPTPLSANTIHQTHRILSRALKVAVQRKKLLSNPAGGDSMDAPPAQEIEVVPMTRAEVERVRTTAEGRWNAARWNVALALGLRQGEALGLRWEDVDLEAGELSVRQTLMRLKGKGIVFGTPKSKMSRRTVSIPPSLLRALKAHRKAQRAKRLELGSHWTDSGLVFTLEDGRPLDPSVDAGRWRQLLKDAGVRHYRLHDARHSAATIMVANGVDIRVAMKILGHSQLSVTMKYQHVVDDLMRDAAAKIDAGGLWG